MADVTTVRDDPMAAQAEGARRAGATPAVEVPDDRGAMPLAMLLTVVGLLLSAVLASIVTVQTTASRRAVQGLHALDAAQAGLDVVVGHIRAAADGSGNGTLASLPCGPFSGQVGVGGAASYSVTVAYRTKSDGAAMTCLTGSGVSTTPTLASLVSQGTDAVTGLRRTITATYVFSTTNANIAGGLIHVFRTATSSDLCLDAGSATPSVGAALTVQLCSVGSQQQTFAYNPNLTITLVPSITTGRPLGLCLDAGAVPHGGATVPVTVQACGTSTLPRQQWSFNDNANLEGTSDGRTLDAHCFNIQSPDVVGSPVVLSTGGSACYTSNTNINSFSPEAEVGAGAAGSKSAQLVNFGEFGRCLDVTGQDWGSAYLQAWPCKQSPDASQVRWNQRWALPATGVAGLVKTSPSYETFDTCLRSPLSSGAGTYVTLTQCPAGTPAANLMWTARGDTGAYATSYTIVDSAGKCLSAADPNGVASDLTGTGWQTSKVIMLPCSDSVLQKWNAPPDIVNGTPLKDIVEQ